MLRKAAVLLILMTAPAWSDPWRNRDNSTESRPIAPMRLENFESLTAHEMSAPALREHLVQVAQAGDTAYQSAPAREPVLMTALSPETQPKSSALARITLSNLAEAIFQRQDVTAPLEALSAVPAVKMQMETLAGFSANPSKNKDAIAHHEPLLNTLLHGEGIHVRLTIDNNDPKATQGKLVLMVCEVVAVFPTEIKGTVVPIYEVKRVDNVKFSDGRMGAAKSGEGFGIIYAEAVDKMVERVSDSLSPMGNYIEFEANHAEAGKVVNATLRNDLSQFKPGELRQAIVSSIGKHEASHVYFYRVGGVQALDRVNPNLNVRAVHESRAFLQQLATCDPRLVSTNLIHMVSPESSNEDGGTKLGAQNALQQLQAEIPSVQFMHPLAFLATKYEVNLDKLPGLFGLKPAEIQHAAAQALVDFDRKYGLR